MFTQSNTSFKQVDTVLCSHADFDEALEFLSFYIHVTIDHVMSLWGILVARGESGYSSR